MWDRNRPVALAGRGANKARGGSAMWRPRRPTIPTAAGRLIDPSAAFGAAALGPERLVRKIPGDSGRIHGLSKLRIDAVHTYGGSKTALVIRGTPGPLHPPMRSGQNCPGNRASTEVRRTNMRIIDACAGLRNTRRWTAKTAVARDIGLGAMMLLGLRDFFTSCGSVSGRGSGRTGGLRPP